MCTPECHGAYVEIEHAGTGCLLPGGSKDLMQVKDHGKHLHLLHHQTRLYGVQLFLNWAMDHKEQEVHDGSCSAGFSINPTHWSSHNVCISEMHQKCPMLTCSRFLFHIKSWESPKEERIRPSNPLELSSLAEGSPSDFAVTSSEVKFQEDRGMSPSTE